MHTNKLICLLFVLLSSTYVYSQCDNSFFDANKYESTIDSGNWFFHFDNLSYFRNAEQTSFVDKGTTYIGFHLLPYVQYSFNENAQLYAGMFLRYDFGNPRIKTLEPYFKFKYRLWDHDILFGSLEGAQQHQLIEPLFDYERAITDRYENGAQIRRIGKHLSYDAWIDWRTMIYENDPFNEEFFAGVNAKWSPINNASTELSLIGQAITVHAAGEVDKSLVPNTIEYNFATGLELNQRLGPETKLVLSAFAAFYEDRGNALASGFKDGLGQLATVRLEHGDYRFSLAYWNSHQFQAPSGEQLYHSLGNKHPANPIDYRQLASLRIAFEKEIARNLVFLSRNGLVYHIDHNRADVIMESYLRWHFTNVKPKALKIR